MPRSKKDFSRRAFIASATAMAAAAALRSAVAKPRLDSSNVHQQAAERARQLAAGRQSVTLTILLPEGSQDNVLPIIKLFHDATGIAVDHQTAPVDDINTLLLLQTAGTKGRVDLALPATFGIPDLAEAGAIIKLDHFAQRYQPADFQSTSLYTLGDFYKGSLYGYQTDGDTYLMFYRDDWLNDDRERQGFQDRYGYPLRVPQTWEQLDAMLAYFHRPEQNRYGGALFRTPGYIAWEWWARFHGKGFFPVNDDFEPQINNAAGIKALEELIDASRYLYPQARSNGLFANWQAYAQGAIFCNIGWGGTQKYLHRQASDITIANRLTFGPLPGGLFSNTPISIPYFNWGWNYTVTSASQEPELAYLFALFACSASCSKIAVRNVGGYFDPFRSEHYADPHIIDAYSQPFLAVHQQSMRDSIPDFYVQGRGEYFSVLGEYLSQADQGNLTPREALDTVANVWRRITRRVGIETQRQQWAFLKSSYPPALRHRLRASA